MELLDQFFHHVRVTKIDQKYKEQYLYTIKQLVQEQVSCVCLMFAYIIKKSNDL